MENNKQFGILIGRDLILQNSGWLLGNGQSINIWNTNWLDHSRPQGVVGPPPERLAECKVSSLLNLDTMEWDTEKIRLICPDFEELILKLKPSKTGCQDKYSWLGTKNGEYSTRSGYYTAVLQTPMQPQAAGSFNWNRNIWTLSTSPKIKMLIWKMFKGAVPVGTRLEERHIPADTRCKRCGEPESIIHLFFHCEYAQAVWNEAPFVGNFELRGMIELEALWNSVKARQCLPPTGVSTSNLAAWILWELWNSRNKLVFTGQIVTTEESLSKAISLAREWQNGQTCPTTKSLKKSTAKHHHHPEALILRTDAAWSASSQMAGLGWTVTNKDRTEMFSSVERSVSSPLMAEALALREALLGCKRMEMKKLVCEADSLQLITSINKGNTVQEIFGVVADILSFALVFESISFVWIPRDQNREADVLAKHILFVSEASLTSN